MNISLRTAIEDVFTKREAVAYIVLGPSNEVDNQSFEEYIKYFKEKERAGVIQTLEYYIYVLPKCE
jgi:hypothetical protein